MAVPRAVHSVDKTVDCLAVKMAARKAAWSGRHWAVC